MAKDNKIKSIRKVVSRIRNNDYLSDDNASKLLYYLDYLSDRTDKESMNICGEIKALLKKRKQFDRTSAFSDEERSYIKHELSSLPFLYAYKSESFKQSFGINRVKFYYLEDDNTIIVLEVYPNKIMKYIIKNDKLTSITGLNNAQFIKEKEKISYEDALKVVCAVYNPEYVVEDQNLLQLINRYLDVLKSDEFRDFLDKGVRIVKDMNGEDTYVSFYENVKKMVEKATSNNSKSNKAKNKE